MTSKNNKAPKYSIAGEKEMENAIQYDLNNMELEKMYNRAKSLHLNGVDNETIRKQTHAICNWIHIKKIVELLTKLKTGRIITSTINEVEMMRVLKKILKKIKKTYQNIEARIIDWWMEEDT